MRYSTAEDLRALMGVDWTFSDEQFACVTAPLTPGVVIAGAGSGKTEVMAARVLWLVANEIVRPEQVLGLTFTTKATGELAHRVRASLLRAGLIGAERTASEGEDESDEPAVSTYHSYAANLLREHGLRIGHEPDTRLIADAQRYQLAARAIARHHSDVRLLSDHPATVITSLLALDSEMSEHLASPDDVRSSDARDRAAFAAELIGSRAKKDLERWIDTIDKRTELLELVDGYRALKAELGLMDFSDQIALIARLAEEHPEVGQIERERYRVVLLDEYQDTSVAQALMLRHLFGGGHPVLAVGDPNQAIYGWRGASVSNILGFPEDFAYDDGPDRRLGATYHLATNRRSDRRILAAANHLAAPLLEATDRVVPLQAKPDAADGEVVLHMHVTYDDELAWLAEQVTEAHEAGTPWREIGVLTRSNAHAGDAFDALTEASIPVEIVGLKGLLRLPEVSEVLATLALIADVTANAELLALLSGPRWQIGLRDLSLLGSRASELAGGRRLRPEVLSEQLAQAVATADPIEIPALSDALESPGDADYSHEALERFGLLAAELRRLRGYASEPVLDIVRRIIDVTGIDLELASSTSPAAAARRDNLDLFIKAVSDFTGLDGRTDLSALLAWLDAEDESGQGLDVAVPTEADSVKLLTIHRSKGLEWDVVFLPGVGLGRFPVDRLRSSFLTSPGVLPPELRGDKRDVPTLRARTRDGVEEYNDDRRDHQLQEELRLGYVGWTRARHRLVVSSWRWKRGLKKPVLASPYLKSTRAAMAEWGAEPGNWIEDVLEEGESSPYANLTVELPWPISHHTFEVDRRLSAAAAVLKAGIAAPSANPLIARWDAEIDRLIEEVRLERSTDLVVQLPSALSATSLARLRNDPDAFARDLARPVPRRPAHAARFGTRFHAWVESRAKQQGLFDPDELPGRADTGIEDEADLRELMERFETGPFGSRPAAATEASFSLVLAGQVIRGQIDAVFEEPDGSWLIVDWKTNKTKSADPLQLSIYRLAWAELQGVPVESVRAAFYYVRSGEVVEPPGLVDRADLEAILDSGLR